MSDPYSNYQQQQKNYPTHHQNFHHQQQPQMMLQQQQHQIYHQPQQQQATTTGQVGYHSNNVQLNNNQNQAHTQIQISQPQKSDIASSTNIYLALLGLAESFQQSNQYRLCIHCLESILTLKPHDMPIQVNLQIQIKTRLNLCRLYLKHTVNTNQYINAHLEKSMILVQNLNSNDEYKYEATYIIYKIFQKQKEYHNQLKQNSQTDPSQLISLYNLDFVRNIFDTSKSFPLWHLRLIFLISNILFKERDFNTSATYITMGIDYCSQNRISPYTHILFILSKGMIHLVQKNSTDLQTTMQPCAQMIESYQSTNLYQIESLKIFFLVLQVAYFLQCGQTKSVRNTLKNLQHYIQSLAGRLENETNEQSLIISQNAMENFFWMHKDHLGILAFILTITNNLQSGSYDKADKLIERALLNIQKLKLKEQNLNSSTRSSCLYTSSSFITNKFNFLLHENQIRCQLTMGYKTRALKFLGDAFQLCDQDQRLMNLYSSQLHCLVGLYALTVNAKEAAISQFNITLKTTNDTDLWLYSAMNLALCYLDNSACTNSSTKTQLISILDNVVNDKLQTQNTALIAFSNFFKALKSYLNSQHQSSQESLREAIVAANSEDLLNISANSYLFLGHIALLMNQFQESYNMLVNGIDLAEKMPDITLKIYGNSLLKYIYKYFNDPREAETSKKFSDAEKQNSKESYEASIMPQHVLINWNTNSSPMQLIANINRQMNSSNQVLNSPQAVHHSPKVAQQQSQPQVQAQAQAQVQPRQHPNVQNYAHNNQTNQSTNVHTLPIQHQKVQNVQSPPQQYQMSQQQQQQQQQAQIHIQSNNNPVQYHQYPNQNHHYNHQHSPHTNNQIQQHSHQHQHQQQQQQQQHHHQYNQMNPMNHQTIQQQQQLIYQQQNLMNKNINNQY